MRASERAIILPITIGSILEWYEIFLYIYWAPIITKTLFDYALPIAELINAISVFVVGFIARPLGGLIFGYIGDRWGRKKSFILSILLVSLPSFGIALIPSYSTWNAFALGFLGLMKFIQGIPAGGELPGAICFLAECSTPERKRYICSYAFVGSQIGQLISMTECLLLEKYLPHEWLVEWGWRLSFFIGGILGLFGYYLRKKLHESHPFQKLKEKHEVLKNPLKESLKNHKKNILLGIFISLFEVVGFFMITVFPVEYFEKLFRLNISKNIIINGLISLLCILLLPLIGKIGDKYKNKPLFILSAIGVIAFSYPYYLAVKSSSLTASLIIEIILVLFFSIQFALLPSLISELYPTPVRFTCIGFSFNVCDSVFGGFAPILGIFLVQLTGIPASFIAIFPIAALIFLVTLFFVKIKEIPSKRLNY